MTAFLITEVELEILYEKPWSAQLTYFRALRPYMDYRTGIVGSRRGISYRSIMEELTVPEDQGRHDKARRMPTEKMVRHALDVLKKSGLIEQIPMEKKLVFRLPYASWDQSAQNMRGGSGAEKMGGMRGMSKASNSAGFGVMKGGMRGRHEEPMRGAHPVSGKRDGKEDIDRCADPLGRTPTRDSSIGFLAPDNTPHTDPAFATRGSEGIGKGNELPSQTPSEPIGSGPSQGVSLSGPGKSAPKEPSQGPAEGTNLPLLPPMAVPIDTARPTPPTQAVWLAYSTAYRARYGPDPVRNAKVNGQVTNLVARLGAEEAPLVAAFYLTQENDYYLRKCHAIGSLLEDAEILRTKWVVSRRAGPTEAEGASAPRPTVRKLGPADLAPKPETTPARAGGYRR